MTTQRDDVLDRVAGLLEPTPEALPDFHRRLQRRHRSRQIGAYAMVAAMVAIAVVAISVVGNGPTPPVPADDPTPSEDLGIFGPVAGWIVYNDESDRTPRLRGQAVGRRPGLARGSQRVGPGASEARQRQAARVVA